MSLADGTTVIRRIISGVTLSVFLIICGCGGGSPFEMAPVEGKVTYADGSLIEADRIVVTFIPQGIDAKGRAAPSAGRAEVNPEDGTFEYVTTTKYQDGALVGQHKVLVETFRKAPNGIDIPNGAVDRKYSDPKATDLTFEVESGGSECVLLVEKPANSRR